MKEPTRQHYRLATGKGLISESEVEKGQSNRIPAKEGGHMKKSHSKMEESNKTHKMKYGGHHKIKDKKMNKMGGGHTRKDYKHGGKTSDDACFRW